MSTRKTKYRRSTPVIRLRRNVEKIIYFVGLGLDRLRNWQTVGNARVERCLVIASEVAEKSVELDDLVTSLEKSGFVPPKRSTAYQPEIGHHVRVVDQARPRYEQLYERQLRDDSKMLDDLMVVQVLASGEVAVQRGKRTPFITRKSHLCPVRVKA